MKRLQENPDSDTERRSQEHFVQTIIEGTDELWQTRREPAAARESVDDREMMMRLRELRSRSTAYGLAFGHRE